VQVSAASAEKYQSESTISRLIGEVDRKVQSAIVVIRFIDGVVISM